jgi:hypothetical protein
VLIKGREYDVVKIGLALVAVIALCSMVWNWYHPKTNTITTTEYRTVPEERIVTKIKRVIVPGPERVVTIEKEAITDKTGVTIPQGKEAVANADIEPSEGGTSVIAVLDMETGETNIVAKEKELSLFGFPSDIEAMLRYGTSTQGIGQQAEIAVRYQFLRVGKFKLGAYGELSSQPQGKAMLEVAYKF